MSNTEIGFWRSPSGAILLNIFGGAIVSFLTWLIWNYLLPKYHKYFFKKVFGRDSLKDFYIVYGLLTADAGCISDPQRKKFPFIKPGIPGIFHSDWVVPLTETKAAKYLSELFGTQKGSLKFYSDDEIEKEGLNISFCSLGGINNSKTVEFLKYEENTFYDFSGDLTSIIRKDQKKSFSTDNEIDYGFIIKIKPKRFQKKVWIAVAGIGSPGMTGAAWYLSKRWKDIEKIE